MRKKAHVRRIWLRAAIITVLLVVLSLWAQKLAKRLAPGPTDIVGLLTRAADESNAGRQGLMAGQAGQALARLPAQMRVSFWRRMDYADAIQRLAPPAQAQFAKAHAARHAPSAVAKFNRLEEGEREAVLAKLAGQTDTIDESPFPDDLLGNPVVRQTIARDGLPVNPSNWDDRSLILLPLLDRLCLELEKSP